jgi:hypothetical protein
LARKTALEQLREAERELETQLRALRERIAVAERGENKRIKDANKYIARTLKGIAKYSREQEKLKEKELEKLERFLGETFESVEEAREAVQKQTRKATQREKQAHALTLRKKATEVKSEKQAERLRKEAAQFERESRGEKLDPKKPSYKVRQLSEAEHQSVVDFLTDKKTFNDAGLGYLQPNERITVSVPYRYFGTDGRVHTGHALGRRLFQNWQQFQAYLISYIGEDSTDEWLGSIEIIKFEGTYDWRVERGKQTDVINKRRKDLNEKRKVRERGIKAKERERSAKQKAKLQAENKELKRKLKGR